MMKREYTYSRHKDKQHNYYDRQTNKQASKQT